MSTVHYIVEGYTGNLLRNGAGAVGISGVPTTLFSGKCVDFFWPNELIQFPT